MPLPSWKKKRFTNQSPHEELIAKILNDNSISYVRQFKLPIKVDYQKNIKCDFFLKDFYIIIEYNGAHHYKIVNYSKLAYKNIKNFERQKKRDADVRKYCKDNNINLFEIDGRKYKEHKLEKLINQFIGNYVQQTTFATMH